MEREPACEWQVTPTGNEIAAIQLGSPIVTILLEYIKYWAVFSTFLAVFGHSLCNKYMDKLFGGYKRAKRQIM